MKTREALVGRDAKRKRSRKSKKRQRRAVHRPLGLGMESLESRRLLAADAFEAIPDADPSVTVGRAVARIVNGDQTDQFEAVGIVNDGCTGTLIAPNVVLTAGHCVENYSGGYIGDTEGTFEVNGQVYSTTSVIAHHDYNGDDLGTDQANDIAIMVLDQNVTGVEPIEFNRTTPFVGQSLTLVGFGGGGTGDGGHNGDFGTKRVGETPIDFVSSTIIAWNFDNNNESNTAPGDSGGPALVSLDGVYYVAGVTSGGDRADAGIGDYSFDTRVDAYADWIDDILAGNDNPDPNPDPSPDPDPNPDPDPDPDPDPNPDPNPNPGDDDHVDNIGADATVIEIQDGFGFVDAWLELVGDHDAFQFTLDQSESVELDLFSWEGDLDTHLAVFDQNGEFIAEDAELGDSQLLLDLDAGLYYVVAGAVQDESNGEYGLDIYLSDQGDWNEGDWNEGDWNEGDWNEGDWNEGDWNEGDWNEGDWNEGDWSEGDWNEGDWSEGGDYDSQDFEPNEAETADVETDPYAHCDVNDDSNVNVIDVYSILNVLFSGEGISIAATDEFSSMDVTGDGNINPQDALRVIDYLVHYSPLSVSTNSEGEGFAPQAPERALPSAELERNPSARAIDGKAIAAYNSEDATDWVPFANSTESEDAVDTLMRDNFRWNSAAPDDELLSILSN